jgi:autotransporter passenger strand-loop-strand repeat protein
MPEAGTRPEPSRYAQLEVGGTELGALNLGGERDVFGDAASGDVIAGQMTIESEGTASNTTVGSGGNLTFVPIPVSRSSAPAISSAIEAINLALDGIPSSVNKLETTPRPPGAQYGAPTARIVRRGAAGICHTFVLHSDA